MAPRHEFNLFADYFQIYLQDGGATGDQSESVAPEAVDRLLAVPPRTIGVGTARNTTAPVVAEIADGPPGDDFGAWDQGNECSIDLSSGRLVIAGCTDYFPMLPASNCRHAAIGLASSTEISIRSVRTGWKEPTTSASFYGERQLSR